MKTKLYLNGKITTKKEVKEMKTKLYLNGKITTKKEVKEMIGEERLKRMIKESKEAFIRDPSEQNSYFFTGYGMFTIKFE